MAEQPEINADTVDALLTRTDRLIDAEIAVGEGLKTRAAGLTGFAGIILSVAGAFGKIGDATRLHGATKLLVIITFALGLLLLIASVLVAVLIILKPRSVTSVSIEEVRRFPNWESISRPKVDFQGLMLNGLVLTLTDLRIASSDLGKWLQRPYVLLALGIICFATESFVLGYKLVI